MVDLVKFTLRLPSDLAESLRTLAIRENRSLHAQIIHILRRFIDQENAQ